jgi:hypothetical protein
MRSFFLYFNAKTTLVPAVREVVLPFLRKVSGILSAIFSSEAGCEFPKRSPRLGRREYSEDVGK